jgi:hypothetical protein
MLTELIISKGIHIKNNLEFRANAAKVQAAFKLSQASALEEITTNTRHQFTNVAKEILLAKYDVWYRFLTDIEYYLVLATNKNDFDVVHETLAQVRNNPDLNVPQAETLIEKMKDSDTGLKSVDHKYIMKLISLARYRMFNKILLNDKDTFDKQYVKYWNKAHRAVFEVISSKILACDYEQPAKYYTELGHFISHALYHTLYELYELDKLLAPDNVVYLNYDDFINKCYEEFQTNILIHRLTTYKKIIDQDDDINEFYKDDKTVVLKIYSENTHAPIMENIASWCEKNNFKLIKEH